MGIAMKPMSLFTIVRKAVLRIKIQHIVTDTVIIFAAFYAALAVRVGLGADFQVFLPTLHHNILIFVGLRILTLHLMGLYDIIWRYISVRDVIHLSTSVLVSVIAVASSTFFLDLGRLPRSVFIIDGLFVLLGLAGVRLARRYWFDLSTKRAIHRDGRRVLIYGAGQNGRTLASRFSTDFNLRANVVGFVDDDSNKIGRMVAGNKVLGSSADIPDILKRYEVQDLVIAISNPSGETIRDVYQACQAFRVRPKIISGSAQQWAVKSPLEILRDVQLSDLLSRQVKNIDQSTVKKLLTGKRVLVTGAGGSIGSELSRQIYSFAPSRLLLLDHSEYNLYQIDQELRSATDELGPVTPLLMNVRDKKALANVFRDHAPEIVIHAAAYKHVHLVEKNPFLSILNNVLGTHELVELCKAHNVETFVLVSTDKAVNPIGLMGATKRLCEMIVTLAGRETNRRYCAVRFGNVLGSSGSLIPLVKEQILKREPITITDPEMRRYFMLIPEAVSLVLQASALSAPGDIAVLKMGELVKIVDLVHNLITLMGKTVEEVPIIFTGKRPGEKLFEELYLSGREVDTSNPDILMVPRGDALPEELNSQELNRELQLLFKECEDENRNALARVRHLIEPVTGPVSVELSSQESSEVEDETLTGIVGVADRSHRGNLH